MAESMKFDFFRFYQAFWRVSECSCVVTLSDNAETLETVIVTLQASKGDDRWAKQVTGYTLEHSTLTSYALGAQFGREAKKAIDKRAAKREVG